MLGEQATDARVAGQALDSERVTGLVTEQSRRNAIDCTKGILIVLIVAGHNVALMKILPYFREFVYNWHVYSFFLISTLVPFRARKRNFLTDRIFRYYTPFLTFLTVTWLAAGGWGNIAHKAWFWLSAALIGSADLLDRASGARLYWFLPALLGLTIVRWAIAQAGPWHRWLLVGVAVSGFLFSGLIPESLKPLLPLGMPIALYALGPCVLFGCLIDFAWSGGVRRLAAFGFVAALIFAACNVFSANHDTRLVLASFEYFDIRQPMPLFVHALLAMSACAVLLLAATFLGDRGWLAWIGQASLQIYLCHQVIYVVLSKAANRLAPAWVAEHSLAISLAMLIVTFAISMLAAYVLLTCTWLRKAATPRDAAEWREAMHLHRSNRAN